MRRGRGIPAIRYGFVCISILTLLACAPRVLGQQQPVVPTQRPPNPESPNQQQKRVPPVPPGSVLPSYNHVQTQPPATPAPVPTSDILRDWKGLKVLDIRFAGVSKSDLEPLPEKLDQQPNQPLDPIKVRDSLRRLYATDA